MGDQVEFTGSLGPWKFVDGKICLADDAKLTDMDGNRIGTVTSIEMVDGSLIANFSVSDPVMAARLRGK